MENKVTFKLTYSLKTSPNDFIEAEFRSYDAMNGFVKLEAHRMHKWDMFSVTESHINWSMTEGERAREAADLKRFQDFVASNIPRDMCTHSGDCVGKKHKLSEEDFDGQSIYHRQEQSDGGDLGV